MKQRYLDFKDDEHIFERAVSECFKQKWRRTDVLAHVEKYSGISREDILLDQTGSTQFEAVQACGIALEETINNILIGHFDDIDIEPPKIRQRPDGMTGKIRDIALLCIQHQLVEHVTFNLLEPTFKQKLYPTQHASIPGHGQTRLKNQVYYYMRSELPIRYGCKTDMKHAYESVQYSVVIKELKKDIPNATHIFKLLEFLGKLAPGGHLIIGGYLDAWLFNYVMSKVIEHIYTLGTERRDKFIRHAVRIVTYMDDMLILTSSIKGMKEILRSTDKFSKEELGMTLKISSGIIKFLSIEEEKKRKDFENGRGVVPFIDMAGFRIYRSHVTMRRRVYVRARRQFIRAWNEYLRTKTIHVQRARKLISYYGFLKQSDSYNFIKKYHVIRLIRVARKVVSRDSAKRNRKDEEKINDLRERRIEREAKYRDDREFTGWPPENYHFGKCQRNREGRRDCVPV